MIKKNCIIIITAFLMSHQIHCQDVIMTVKGPINAEDMGTTLVHEHIMLAGFVDPDSVRKDKWDNNRIITRIMPYLNDLKAFKCNTYIECTPTAIGKDPLLLKSLSDKTGMHFITNTGYYGAAGSRFIPAHTYRETAAQVAERWVDEWENGIESTGIKPGFIKIGVEGANLSDIHKKLVSAAGKAHLKTGLIIVSHTGPAVLAFEQIEILKKEGVSPEAFVWAHAQAESDPEIHAKAARMGTWVSLDGVDDNNVANYVKMITAMKNQNLLNKVLISHDAGWYTVGEENGGQIRGFTTIFEKLIPSLQKEGFTEKDIHQLLVINPAQAFKIKIRK